MHHTNRLKDKNHMIIPIYAEKALKIPLASSWKKYSKTRNRKELPQPVMGYLQVASTYLLNNEVLNAFPTRWGIRQACPLLIFLSHTGLNVFAMAIKQDIKTKGTTLEKAN